MTDYAHLPATAFGGPDLEERLAALILAGRKCATVWSGDEPNETAPGMLWRVTAGGRDVAVIRTLSVERRRFCDIDAEFAFTEGEGNRSLEFWQVTHERYFRKAEGFSPEMMLWCERFECVASLDDTLAAVALDHVAREEAEALDILAEARAEMSRWSAGTGSATDGAP